MRQRALALLLVVVVFATMATRAAPAVLVVGNTIYPSPDDQTAQCLDSAERVCIGNYLAARNTAHLRALGITHMVTAIGEPRSGRVPHIEYLVLDLDDTVHQDMREAFARSHEFIVRALASSTDARVLVHCAAGVSRSAALVIHHLMRTHHALTYDMALTWLQSVRHVVQPNSAFERQLRALSAHTRRNET
jgi:predicted protein tyrosine phosphatase